MNQRFHEAVFKLCFSVVSLLAVVPAASAQAPQENGVWSALGATAIVDEANARQVVMHSTGSVALSSAVTNAEAVVRYNLHPSWNLRDWRTPDDDFGLDTTFYALVRDTGATARVVLKLQEMDDQTGAIRTISVIDTDNPWSGPSSFPPSTDYAYIESPVSIAGFDFHNKSYFVEATLTKTAASGNLGIKLLKVQQFP